MTRRVIVVLLVVVLAVAVAGLLWAKTAPGKGTHAVSKMVAGKGKMAPMHSEYTRCAKTCNALLGNYQKQYAKMKTHEGDKTCWANCWTRFGSGDEGAATDQKKLWTTKMTANMRVNQCSQACWRTHHKESRTVSVAGWRSEPRPSTVCSK